MRLSRRNISNVIICDDVRKEDNGKIILIGVYPAGILTSSLPSQLAFMTYFEVIPVDQEPVSLTARVHFGRASAANAPLQMRLDIKFANMEATGVILPKVGFNVTKPGTYYVDISFDGHTWVNLAKKSIDLMPRNAISPTSSRPLFGQSPPDVPAS